LRTRDDRTLRVCRELLGKLSGKQQREQINDAIRRRLRDQPTSDDKEGDRSAREAIAAAALLRLGYSDLAERHLGRDGDPHVRNSLLRRIAQLQVPFKTIWNDLKASGESQRPEPDAMKLQSLILTLVEYINTPVGKADREYLRIRSSGE